MIRSSGGLKLKTGAWLGIETTGEAAGTALVLDGGIMAEESFQAVGALSEELLPGIQRMFRSCGLTDPSGQIKGVAVSAGPGSYTGLRIGIATAEGLAAGWGVGLKGVDTLFALAVSTGVHAPVFACARARRGEVFACLYSSGTPAAEELAGPGVYSVTAAAGLLRGLEGTVAVGSGRLEMPDIPGLRWFLPALSSPPASIIASAGEFLVSRDGFDPSIRPRYLRGFMERAVNAFS
jgi:tRNA threonylcarbamoyl adenosine modification protein YeaZ